MLLAPDGTAYLGLGLIGLLVGALTWAPRAFFAPLRRHLFLCAALFVLLAFSVSNRVLWARQLVLRYPLPGPLEALVRNFPITARFFWPVALALVAWLVVVVSRRFSAPAAAALLAATCAVQWVDLGGARTRWFEHTLGEMKDALGPARPAWSALVARHGAVEVFPSYECADPTVDNEFDLQLQLMAVQARVSTNSAYLARPNKDCVREAERERRALHETAPAGVLRVFYRHPGGEAPDAHDEKSCRPFARGLACTRVWADPTMAPWAAVLRVGS